MHVVCVGSTAPGVVGKFKDAVVPTMYALLYYRRLFCWPRRCHSHPGKSSSREPDQSLAALYDRRAIPRKTVSLQRHGPGMLTVQTVLLHSSFLERSLG